MTGSAIRLSAAQIDLSGRVFASTAIVGNPANAGEAIVCRLTLSGDYATTLGVIIAAFVSVRASLNATAVNLRVRQTNVAGAVVIDSQAIPSAANTIGEFHGLGLDTAPLGPPTAYVLTLEVASATNASTVGSVALVAVAV